MSRFVLGFVMAGVLATATPAHADTMRCGNALVVEGDSMYDVVSRCGQAVVTLHRTEVRTAPVWINGRAVLQSVEVAVDEWTYDFGPQRFVQHVTFEQGRVVSIVSGRRGQRRD